MLYLIGNKFLSGVSNLSISIISKSFNNTFHTNSVNLQQSGIGPWILQFNGAENRMYPSCLDILLSSFIAENGLIVCSRISKHVIISYVESSIWELCFVISPTISGL